MKFKNKNILLISPEPWEHNFISKHHYAIHLAQNNNVFFLNPPGDKNSIENTTYDNLRLVNYNGFLPGLRYLPRIIRNKLIRKVFNRIEKICKHEFDVIWSFDNSVFFDFEALPDQLLCISHIVDLNQNFNTELAAKTADICIGVSMPIYERLIRFNKNTILIKHGVNLTKVERLKAKLPGYNKIKALYIGNLDMIHIDWALLDKVVKVGQNVDFILMGSGSSFRLKHKSILNNENLYIHEPIKSEWLLSYLEITDIQLILYDEKYVLNYASPHKMLEYFLSKKMILSTWLEEYRLQNDQKSILMSKTHEEFIANFKEIINNLDFWNSVDKQSERHKFALENTYEKQIERIEKALHI